jgi:hypothetical protein
MRQIGGYARVWRMPYVCCWHCDGRSICIEIQMRRALAMLARAAKRAQRHRISAAA